MARARRLELAASIDFTPEDLPQQQQREVKNLAKTSERHYKTIANIWKE